MVIFKKTMMKNFNRTKNYKVKIILGLIIKILELIPSELLIEIKKKIDL